MSCGSPRWFAWDDPGGILRRGSMPTRKDGVDVTLSGMVAARWTFTGGSDGAFGITGFVASRAPVMVRTAAVSVSIHPYRRLQPDTRQRPQHSATAPTAAPPTTPTAAPTCATVGDGKATPRQCCTRLQSADQRKDSPQGRPRWRPPPNAHWPVLIVMSERQPLPHRTAAEHAPRPVPPGKSRVGANQARCPTCWFAVIRILYRFLASLALLGSLFVPGARRTSRSSCYATSSP